MRERFKWNIIVCCEKNDRKTRNEFLLIRPMNFHFINIRFSFERGCARERVCRPGWKIHITLAICAELNDANTSWNTTIYSALATFPGKSLEL